LAFIQTVDRFFADLGLTTWPLASVTAISPDATIGARVRFAAGVVIGSDVSIADDVSIGPNTCIANTSIARGVSIGANCSIGLPGFGYARNQAGELERFPHLGRVRIHERVEIGSNTCIDRGSIGDTIIGEGSKIDNLVHVAHNVVLGRNVVLIANSMIGGSTTIGDDAWVAPAVSVMDQIAVGNRSVLGLGAVVLKDVAEDAVMVGNPARKLEPRDP
jgi:UDP-3-O-[3-hydroxymyristoyl] glucosamine N-acyltransferase